MPLISVIIPMRNAEAFVAETLRSLLAQEGCDFEIIVIDDGSTDRSADVVRGIGDRRIRIIPGPQKGISAAFNAGMAAATGEYLCRCDADDLYPAGRLAVQVKFLTEQAEVGAVCGSYRTISSTGKHVTDHFADSPPGEITAELIAGHGRSHMCAYLFRTSVLRAIGGCREWFITSEDADLQFRLAESTRIWFLPDCAYFYRLHDASITHAQKSAQRKFFEQCAQQFLLQRRAGEQDDLQRGSPPALPAGESDKPRSSSRQIQQILLGEAWKQHAAGLRGKALSTGLRACRAGPINLQAWKSLIALAVKPVKRRSVSGQ